MTKRGQSKELHSKEFYSKELKDSHSRKRKAQSAPGKSVKSKETFTAHEGSREQRSIEAVSRVRSPAPNSKKSFSTSRKDNDKESIDASDEEVFRLMGRALTHSRWYHGLMPRDEIEDLIKNEGDFLVRKTEVKKAPKYAVSVMNKDRLRHILLNYRDGSWWLRETKKTSVSELIDFHVKEKAPVQSDGTILVTPVPRPDFYILHEHVDVKVRVGGGAFGEVFTGSFKKSDSETVDVAVKKLKGMMKKKQRLEFIREAKLMKRFDHPNIVRVFGVAIQEEPVMIVLELAAGGSLQGHLKAHPETSIEQLLNYCKDAARGMCYLSSRQVIHRDIAARNCLLGASDELKISDFGLSIADTSVVKLEKLRSMPVKWLAPETLRKGEFSSKTDVWSYGILVWEIFSRCKADPFPGDSNAEAKKKILGSGPGSPPMSAPDGCPEEGLKLMQLCFTQNPDERADFEVLFKLLAPNEALPQPQPCGDSCVKRV
ncbi:hypothetical protein L596_024832 [Steinernema carpocapsae]|uniref:Tyrosine-protein kinase n=1 Tax=Steinernema carpocapsae TaxID=34508 RepID=A0A4U5M5X9_STECR|nr:hypothetical protein L596_024832 [Steinernema carpocapsae]